MELKSLLRSFFYFHDFTAFLYFGTFSLEIRSGLMKNLGRTKGSNSSWTLKISCLVLFRCVSNRPFHGFFNFWHEQVREKISRHHWEERLKISKIAKFESASAFPKKIIRFLLSEKQMK